LLQNNTSTLLVSSLNPSIYGQKVTWTATVTSSGSITPTGKVRFTSSGYTIGSATLNSGGVASLTRSNLNADPYPLTAVYVGDAANLGSTSAVLNQVGCRPRPQPRRCVAKPVTQGQAVTFLQRFRRRPYPEDRSPHGREDCAGTTAQRRKAKFTPRWQWAQPKSRQRIMETEHRQEFGVSNADCAPVAVMRRAINTRLAPARCTSQLLAFTKCSARSPNGKSNNAFFSPT
jgi:hypothetical protein